MTTTPTSGLEYNQWFGVFLTIIDVPLMIVVFAFLVLKGRKTNVIQKRASMFFFIELSGIFVCCMIFNAYLLAGDLELCHLRNFVSLTFALYALPLLIRCWIYGFRYYLTQVRKTVKSEITPVPITSSPSPSFSDRSHLASPSSSSLTTTTTTTSSLSSPSSSATPTQYSPFFMRRLWLISPKFLLYFFLIALFIHVCLPVMDQINSVVIGSPASAPLYSGICDQKVSAFQPIFYVLAALYITAFVITAIFLRKSEDAYRIKNELFWLALNWIFTGVLYALSRFLKIKERPLGHYLPSMFILSAGLLSSFIISGVFSLYLVRKENLLANGKDDGDDDHESGKRDFLHDITHSASFRAKFADFLCLQLSIENLLFWEDVQKYKSSPPRMMPGIALSIYNKYIKEGSTFEVNISDTARQNVTNAVLSSPSPAKTAPPPSPATSISISNDITPSGDDDDVTPSSLQDSTPVVVVDSPPPPPPSTSPPSLADIFRAAEVEVYANLRFHSYPCYIASRRSAQSSASSSNNTDNESSSSSSGPHTLTIG
eukprot:TRINITY_DN9015_c0_g1_i4.p1 TRINITY_DN9015_c0_g1~~TRINITY_DN9015_c0_g1_i4.p1  ORF type:complete len:543 (-),score=99.67 TRINITY_DN9015_c0_g1_i4:3-1631(-)